MYEDLALADAVGKEFKRLNKSISEWQTYARKLERQVASSQADNQRLTADLQKEKERVKELERALKRRTAQASGVLEDLAATKQKLEATTRLADDAVTDLARTKEEIGQVKATRYAGKCAIYFIAACLGERDSDLLEQIRDRMNTAAMSEREAMQEALTQYRTALLHYMRTQDVAFGPGIDWLSDVFGPWDPSLLGSTG